MGCASSQIPDDTSHPTVLSYDYKSVDTTFNDNNKNNNQPQPELLELELETRNDEHEIDKIVNVSDVSIEIHPILLCNFSNFKNLTVSLSLFPTRTISGDSVSVFTPLTSIDRQSSLIIFISHCCKEQHSVDDKSKSKEIFNSCVEGIEKLRTHFAPKFQPEQCFVFINSCYDINTFTIREYEYIISQSDCIFTPHTDITWDSKSNEYLNCKQCRIDILYSSIIPLLYNDESSTADIERLNSFEFEFKLRHFQRSRPHVISRYAVASTGDEPLIILPALSSDQIHQFLSETLILQPDLTMHSSELHVHALLDASVSRVHELLTGVSSEPLNSEVLTVTNDLGKYHGEVLRGYCMHGTGKIQYANGDKYEGVFAVGKRHGKGVFTSKDGEEYAGEFVWNKPQGTGKLTSVGGDVYTGQFHCGKKHGHGLQKWKNGDLYVGEFRNKLRHGHGVLTTADGSIYDGSFIEGKKSGEGSFHYSNGDSYTGNFESGRQNGFGVVILANGEKYTGEWRDGQYHGLGKYEYTTGDVYEGSYEEGSPVIGQGKLTRVGGSVLYENSSNTAQAQAGLNE